MRRRPRRFSSVLWGLLTGMLLLAACGMRVQVGKVFISRTLTCQGIGPGGEPVGVTSFFPYGTERIYFFFDLEGPVSVPLEIRWLHEGVLVAKQEIRADPGVSCAWLEAEDHFAPGRYEVDVVMGEVVMARAEFVVARGPTP